MSAADDDRFEAACENILGSATDLWRLVHSDGFSGCLMEIYTETVRAISLAEDAGWIGVERDGGEIRAIWEIRR